MIIVTGGSGFIGSNLVNSLNKCGYEDIIVVDDLKNGHKLKNLFKSKISSIENYKNIENVLKNINFSKIKCIFHLGACSDTTEWDGEYIMNTNYDFSKMLLSFALNNKIQFIYASSASVYGMKTLFDVNEKNEAPINAYAYSKLLFDQHVRRVMPNAHSQIVGLRYFNVYGPHEEHKKSMASVIYHFYNQITNHGEFFLFGENEGVEAGEQSRDFVHVDDTVRAKLWFMENAHCSGIFNVGTGNNYTYNTLADYVIDWFEQNLNLTPSKQYREFPENLRGSYQNYTKADLGDLRNIGYDKQFKDLKDGVFSYLDYLHGKK